MHRYKQGHLHFKATCNMTWIIWGCICRVVDSLLCSMPCRQASLKTPASLLHWST